MLVKVKPEDVTLGMYIQGFEGGWFNHPFWRSKFLLTEEADLDAVRTSGVAAVLVDAALSTSPPTPANDAAEPAPVAEAPAPVRRPPSRMRRRPAPPSRSSAVPRP
jgi:hypothetical protein